MLFFYLAKFQEKWKEIENKKKSSSRVANAFNILNYELTGLSLSLYREKLLKVIIIITMDT